MLFTFQLNSAYWKLKPMGSIHKRRKLIQPPNTYILHLEILKCRNNVSMLSKVFSKNPYQTSNWRNNPSFDSENLCAYYVSWRAKKNPFSLRILRWTCATTVKFAFVSDCFVPSFTNVLYKQRVQRPSRQLLRELPTWNKRIEYGMILKALTFLGEGSLTTVRRKKSVREMRIN